MKNLYTLSTIYSVVVDGVQLNQNQVNCDCDIICSTQTNPKHKKLSLLETFLALIKKESTMEEVDSITLHHYGIVTYPRRSPG